MPARRHATSGALVAAGLLLLSACGSAEPAALSPIAPDVPANLCSTIPEDARAGLVVASNTSTEGNPTAACSLRSESGAAEEVRAVVTWTHLDDSREAASVLASQCRAIDPEEYVVQQTMAVEGVDASCGGTGRSRDSSTIAATSGREVLTVRVGVKPPGKPDALARAQAMLAGVLASMANPDLSTSPSP